MPLEPLSKKMKLRARFAGWVRFSTAAVVLFPTLIFGNAVQMITLVIRPFSAKVFRKINRFGANTWWGWCVLWAEKLYGTRVEISGDDVPAGENAVLVVNHQEMVDIPVLFSLAWRKKRLGDMKWFVKDIVKYVPGFGWGLAFLDTLFVKRNWTADKNKIAKTFRKVMHHRVPLWLVTFTEGTRLKFNKLKESQQYAMERNLTRLQHVMVPRTKGFVATLEGLRGHVDAVYDITIGYVDGVPNIMHWAKGHVKRAHLHVRRFAISDIPQEKEKLAEWLHERFQEKDRLLEHYYAHGAFPTTGWDAPMATVSTPNSL